MSGKLNPADVLRQAHALEAAQKLGLHYEVPIKIEDTPEASVVEETQTDALASQQAQDETNPVTKYVQQMIWDLLNKKHIMFKELIAVRSVFISVLRRLCDAEPHTFADIRSSITPSRRGFVKQVLYQLRFNQLVHEVELNGKLFYRANLDELYKIRAYVECFV